METLAIVIGGEKGRSPKCESQILGREATREDWIRDVHLRLGILFTNPPEHDLESMLGERFKYRVAYARPAMESICQLVDNRPEGYLNEIKKVRDIIGKSSVIDLADCSPTSEAISSHVHREVADFQAQRTSIYDEWNEIRDQFGEGSEALTGILRGLKALGSDLGSDRSGQVKELKRTLLTFPSAGREMPPIINLCLGWLCTQLHDGMEEAIGYLRIGSQSSLSTMSSHLCCRALSDIYEREGQTQRALEWSKKALEHLKTPEGQLDAVLLIAQSHESGAFRGYLEDALATRPVSLVALLADERSLDLGTELLDIIVKIQSRLRRAGRQALGQWHSAVKSVNEAERIAGVDLQLSHELLESHSIVEQRLAESDLLTAWHLSEYALEASQDLIRQAKESLQREFDKKRDALSDARRIIDSVGMQRDQRVIEARKDHERLVAIARKVLTDAAAKTQGMEKQSIYWFGSGCGLFALYVATKFVFSSDSSHGDLSSPLSFLMLLIAGVPIALAITLQVVFGVRRAALEIQVKEKITVANKRYSQAEREADDFHRDQLSNGRKALIEAENKLRKVESSMKYLRLDTGEEVNASTRLKVA